MSLGILVLIRVVILDILVAVFMFITSISWSRHSHIRANHHQILLSPRLPLCRYRSHNQAHTCSHDLLYSRVDGRYHLGHRPRLFLG